MTLFNGFIKNSVYNNIRFKSNKEKKTEECIEINNLIKCVDERRRKEYWESNTFTIQY